MPDWMYMERGCIMEPKAIFHVGDCLDVLPTIPTGSVHCVVTSPPY